MTMPSILRDSDVREAYRRGYEAGWRAREQGAIPPHRVCPGSAQVPKVGSIYGKQRGYAGRGRCLSCDGDYKLTNAGLVIRHRLANALDNPSDGGKVSPDTAAQP